jgi:hypothetical protein
VPRIIEERWMGIGYDVITEHLPQTDERGRPMHDGKGLPITLEHTTLVLICPMPDGQRIVRIPFREEARQQLIQKLTGGIVIPTNGAPHLPFGKGV